MSRVAPLLAPPPKRILDFDCEARATGYGDPNWVPQEVTCIAWSWVDSDKVSCRIRTGGLKRMLNDFRRAYDKADLITGHYVRKFDLPLLNAEMIRNGFPSLGPKLVQDTHGDIVRTKGMKRDQDNLAKLFGLAEDKLALSWHDWQEAYAEAGWPVVKDRCIGDVIQHKKLRLAQLERGWLKREKLWRP